MDTIPKFDNNKNKVTPAMPTTTASLYRNVEMMMLRV